MPKSKKRSGAKRYRPYRPKPIRMDPEALMRAVADGLGSEEDLDVVCDYLLISMQNTSAAAALPWLDLGMKTWPPTTRDDIRMMAGLAFPRENDEPAGQVARVGSAGSEAQ